MKEILGVFAAIAAVTGIASVISKNEEKEKREQKELEMEQQRLNLAAEQSAHRRQMESQKIQIERDRQEYQKMLANAPKKAVYKKASLHCPLCMGQREINETTGLVKCPYCGGAEQLEIDYYKIDQEAFQKQIQEEQQRKAEMEALRKKNEKYNNAIIVLSCLTVFSLILLLASPILGITFFIPLVSLLFFLLYRRFPDKGEKIWSAVKFPLACVLLFPLPLTLLFMKSERFETRYSKAVRISMSIGVWTVYAALICVLGGLYFNGLHKAIDKAETSINESSSESSSVSTTKTTQSTSHITTTQPQELSQMNGFNKSRNQKSSLGGIDWQIPYYYKKDETRSNDSFILYFVNWPNTTENTLLWIGTEKLDYSESEFNNKKEYIRDSLAKNIDVTVNESGDMTLAGLLGYVFSFSDEKGEIQGVYVFAYNAATKDFVRIAMSEPTSKCKSVSDDFVQIIKSAEICNTESNSDAEITETTTVNNSTTP